MPTKEPKYKQSKSKKPKKLIAWMLKDNSSYLTQIYFTKKYAIQEKRYMEEQFDEYYKIIKIEIKEIK
jgi:hypothetical protein